jgi:hypothetical protein
MNADFLARSPLQPLRFVRLQRPQVQQQRNLLIDALPTAQAQAVEAADESVPRLLVERHCSLPTEYHGNA